MTFQQTLHILIFFLEKIHIWNNRTITAVEWLPFLISWQVHCGLPQFPQADVHSTSQ
jgi:hypothetical protein